MPFKVDDMVVYPAFGIGRVVGLVNKSFFEAETQMHDHLRGARTTLWDHVADGSARGLRRLTRQHALPHVRTVVGSQPLTLNQDHRQRQSDLRGQLKLGTMQGLCEIVRDLSARGWAKPLNEMDSRALRMSREAVCKEWAVAEGIPLPQVTAELSALLSEGRTKFQV